MKKFYDIYKRIEPLNKGWSSDRKYCVEAEDGKKLLLRVADISEYEHKKNEFEVMKRIAARGVRMSRPLDFGTCDGGRNVYILLSWCEGEEAMAILPNLSEKEQYALGVEAGRVLKTIHGIESCAESSDWSEIFDKRIDRYIEEYEKCGMRFVGDEMLIRYIRENRKLTINRPMCLTHGDFHAGNLVISPKHELYVIDFQRCGMSDPYYAFRSILFSANVSPAFAKGQVRGYFGGDPPADFWGYLAFYMAVSGIHALPWSIPFGRDEIDFSLKMIEKIQNWFAGMKNPVPTWYRGGDA